MTAYNGNAMQNYHQYQKRCFQKGVVINHKSSRIMIVLLHVPKHMPSLGVTDPQVKQWVNIS